MAKQIAEFVTKRERPSIKIDGVAYALTEPDELKLSDALWLERASKRMDELLKQMSDDSEGAATDELGSLVFRVSDILMREVPEQVRAKLTDIQKLAVVQAYMNMLQAVASKATRSPLAEGEDGKPSSLDSSASTEVPLSSGGS